MVRLWERERLFHHLAIEVKLFACSKKLSLGVSVINIFNEKGAKGTISGSELITKQEAGKYEGKYMSGSYLRPFTVEFSAGIKF